MLYPHIDAADYVELVKTKKGDKQALDLVFKTEDGREYYHSKELRGMETICYKLFSYQQIY